ncbi:amidohydrolase family protein (plasmid) [Rhodobacteraceae bacterium M382]|nr:amidohydrolase family protein [Rhodobacteraceae bacterium M382]
MTSLLLTGRWVVLCAQDVRTNTSVLIRNGRVADVGPTRALRQQHAGLPEIGGLGCAILPGLINAHHHCYGVELANQAIADDFLEPWMFNGPAMVDLSPHVATAHAGARLLQTGVTAVVDMCAAGASRAQAETSLTAKADAYRQLGLRAAIAPGERWQNRIVHGTGEEAAFLATLPLSLRRQLARSEAARERLSATDYLDLVSSLARDASGPQSFWFGPTGPQWTPDNVLRKIAQAAERVDTRIQTHALESHYESLESPRIRAHSVIAHFERMGLLGGRLSLAHAVWATPSDIDMIAARGTQVSHNPGSNLRLRSGIAPAATMLDAGVTVALGMDGTTLAGDEDMFAEMRLALTLNQPPHVTAPALTARRVLEMATQDGARLLGRGHELGQLYPGYCADAVVLDLTRMTAPWTSPAIDPVELIVGRAKAQDVRHVLIDGHTVLQDRHVTGLNTNALMDQLRAELDRTPPAPVAAQLQRDLRPYLMRWYARWDCNAENTHPPVTRYGARSNEKDFQ